MEEPSTSVVSSLRSRNPDIYLVGQPCMSIMGTKLPSHRQVLQLLFFQTRLAKSRKKVASLNDSASLVTDSVIIFWRQAAIPTRKVQHVKDKVLALHEQWKKLQKNEKTSGAAHKEREIEFSDKLDDLFDIAHANLGKHQVRKCQCSPVSKRGGINSNRKHTYLVCKTMKLP